MPEDVTKETATTSDGGKRTRMRLASEEFFFLLQRIDRLDEKLSGEIKAQGERIDRLDEKLNLGFRGIGIIVTLIVGFTCVIVMLAMR